MAHSGKKDISKTAFITIAVCIITAAVLLTFAASKLIDGKNNDGITAQEGTASPEFSFTAQGNGWALSSYNGTASSVTVPGTYEGKAVIAVNDGAFKNNGTITSVTLPETVTSIGSEAFYMCEALTEINLPDSITAIGSYAFCGCKALCNAALPSGLITVSDFAFAGCERLTELTFGNRTAKIGEQAFAYCSGITSLSLPDSVTAIGNASFYSCELLSSVSGGAGLTSIGAQAFEGTAWLKSEASSGRVIIGGVLVFASASGSYRVPDGIGYIADYAFYKQDKLTSVTFPETVINIGTYAFGDCTALSLVTLPQSLKSMGNGVFSGCVLLKSLTLNGGLESMGTNCFFGCSSLAGITVESENTRYFADENALYSADKTVLYRYFQANTETEFSVPDTVTTLYTDAFSGSLNLKSVTVGAGVSALGERVFYGCTGIQSMTLPDSIDSIPTEAFAYCTSLSLVNLPGSIEKISNRAFLGCTNLLGINIPVLTESISPDAFCECIMLSDIKVDANNEAFTVYENVLFTKDMATLLLFPAASAVTKYEIPDGVTEIKSNAFLFCVNLQYIYLNSSLKTIGTSAFYGCTGLRAVRNNSGNTSFAVEDGVLFSSDMTKLLIFPSSKPVTQYTVPESVTEIDDSAFMNVQMLTSLTIGSHVTAFGAEVFENSDKLTVICPADSEAYNYCSENGVKTAQ